MKWRDVEPGDSYSANPLDGTDPVWGIYVVLTADRKDDSVMLTVLLSTGKVEQWAGHPDAEYYDDTVVWRAEE